MEPLPVGGNEAKSKIKRGDNHQDTRNNNQTISNKQLPNQFFGF